MFNETKIKQIVAISVLLAATKCTKFVFGRGSAPDPAGGAHDASPDPLVDWGGGYLLPIPLPLGASILTPSASSLPAFCHFFFHSLTTGVGCLAV